MNLEENVVGTVHSAITGAIKSSLEGFNSPLQPFIKNVIERRKADFENLLNEAVTEALTGDFREVLKDACAKKLAKVIISKSEGEIEKQANDLRSSPEFRAKLTVAISVCVKGFRVT